MDEQVRQAMAKWPNVPACYGWLGLDARGHWYMRDPQAQQCGGFASQRPGSQGARLQHAALIAFIARNYAQDAQGRCYFQNGPQRVYVELAHTPYVWRIEPDFSVRAHTEQAAHVQQAWVDENGLAYLHTDLGFGLVHSLDTERLAQALERGRWCLGELRAQELPERFHFILSPQAQQNQAKPAP